MLPKFFCVGFQKCGTTTLYDILKQHRDIVLTESVKEPMYYRVDGWSAPFGVKGYERRYFGHVSEEDPRLAGEVNAGLAANHTPDRIAKDFPVDTKFIFMMREPVSRTYSAYKYFLARGFLPVDIMRYDEAFGHAKGFGHYVNEILGYPEGKESYRKKTGEDARGPLTVEELLAHHVKYQVFTESFYAENILKYLQHFPKENMKFIFFEDFVRDQKGVCQDIYKFLGIEDDPEIRYDLKSNEGILRARGPIWSKWLIAWKSTHYFLDDFVNVPGHAPHLNALINLADTGVEHLTMREDADDEKMLPVTRKRLQAYFRDEIRRTEALIGMSAAGKWY